MIGDNPTPLWETYSLNYDSDNKDSNGDYLTDSDIHNIGSALATDYGIQARSGGYVARLYADGRNYDDPDSGDWSKRSELGNRNWQTRIRQDEEAFYSTSMYFPSTYWDEVTRYSIIVLQNKQYNGGSPNFELRMSNLGDYKLFVRSEYHLGTDCDQSEECEIAQLQPDTWHDVNVHLNPSCTADGFMDVYIDGTLVWEYDGATLKNCGELDDSPEEYDSFLKFGMYTEIRNERVIYLDDVELTNRLNVPLATWVSDDRTGLPIASISD